ncbi:type I methionyl aminopeptidase [Nesterenkonia sp. LB17]|uniref:type I methionyl aminopeptidase n=1 Tax=unclassified Nesterenkonia TaxID=2629769 RepID=UPI001F4D3402|nr:MULTISPECIES: type I methionyl aminopeptidase [unclassified Nesterenkonia]MCH8559177.1 type I methionyl aminopeptidase [Nesterenkonia sp. DZ6]MCH8563090.1 type I methionyl aminopeptidase [Nesterenkonia sp. YGD6]MCH8565094.1 type I methionyl aminopeptidase [Nesterenkonia sp. LB17]
MATPQSAPLSSRAPVGTLTKGTVSPQRPVPAHIDRPNYVGLEAPPEYTGEDVYDAETVERIRRAAQLAADAMVATSELIRPGVTTEELDAYAHQYLTDRGAYPSCLSYRGFPKAICTSVNEVICHGIPDSTVLAEGDIVNLDITAYIDGVHGDHNRTFFVGEVDEETRLLVERTEEAMMRAIRAVKPGRPINVIGRAIESYARRFGYGVVREFIGHGVGKAFHTGLVIPHFDAAPDHARLMEPGMVFTIEPMLTLGTRHWDMWEDGWTAVTRDRKRTAQFEHTLVVTDDGAEILTLPSGS